MPPHRPSTDQRRPDLTPYGTHQRRQQRTAEPDGRHQSYDRIPRYPSEVEPIDSYPIISTPGRGGEGLLPLRGGSYDGASGPVEDRNQDPFGAQPAIVEPAKLELLSLFEWDDNMVYDEEPPTCIHYSIEWKITLNKRLFTKDTEQDLVLAPSQYWSLCLRPKLEEVLCKKLPPSRRVKVDKSWSQTPNRGLSPLPPTKVVDTNVVVSVKERSERDLTKRFDEAEIDWPIVEKQLIAWGELFRAGKKLRVDLSLNYVDIDQSSTTSLRNKHKRGSSATQRMLHERASQLETEENITGEAPIWPSVYDIMRCPGPHCDRGPHCWRDPAGQKHYPLKAPHLRALIRYVEQGGKLQTHDDVPEDIRQQLYAEERQRLEKHISKPSSSLPPIHITNVLPTPPNQSTLSATGSSNKISRLFIPGARDTAVKEYSEWQQSQEDNESWKAEYQKACDIALDNGFDLEKIHQKLNYTFFSERDVKLGITMQFVDDIEFWVTNIKCNGGVE